MTMPRGGISALSVFQVEYRGSPRRFCALANAANFNSIKKSGNFRLRARKWKPCR